MCCPWSCSYSFTHWIRSGWWVFEDDYRAFMFVLGCIQYSLSRGKLWVEIGPWREMPHLFKRQRMSVSKSRAWNIYFILLALWSLVPTSKLFVVWQCLLLHNSIPTSLARTPFSMWPSECSKFSKILGIEYQYLHSARIPRWKGFFQYGRSRVPSRMLSVVFLKWSLCWMCSVIVSL